MNQSRCDFGICYDDKLGEVYVFGGYNGSAIEHCEKYNVEKD